jgi:hypothetical protein
MEEPRIVKAIVVKIDRWVYSMMVELSDGSIEDVCSWYRDGAALAPAEWEVMGRTIKEVQDARHQLLCSHFR